MENIIAIVYDFDKTLSVRDMQEDTIFASYDIAAKEFWARAGRLMATKGYDRILAYLQLLITADEFKNKPLTPESLERMAKKIEYFPGVETYFERINKYVENKIAEPQFNLSGLNIKLEHYLISSGMMEIIRGTSIFPYFKKAYACEFDYRDERPIFPKLVINDTNKTQFLFRINKRKLNLTEDINSHMADENRPVPFQNIIYIGDGSSDVPSMAVTTKNGGYAVAVHNHDCPTKADIEDARCLVKDGRANHMAPANYEEGSHLIHIIKLILDHIIFDIKYRVSAAKHHKKAQERGL